MLSVVALGACGSDAGPDGGASDLANMDAVPRLELEEVVRIGSVYDPDYGFSRVGSVDVDEEGKLYVYEAADAEIRVYSPEGELLRRFGGEGEGPGEFSGSSLDFGVWGDTVWAFDEQGAGLTLFDHQGEVRSAQRVEGVELSYHAPGEELRLRPESVDSEGFFVAGPGSRTFPDGDGPVRDSVEVPRVRFDGEGEVVDTVGAYPSHLGGGWQIVNVGSSGFIAPGPPGTDPVIIRRPEGFIRIDQSVPEDPNAIRVTRFDHQANPLSTRALRYEPRGHPEDLLDELAVRHGHSVGAKAVIQPSGVELVEAESEDTAAAREEIRRRIEEDFPERQLPVQGTLEAADGALWLRREQTGGDGARWTVLDAEDRPVGEVVTGEDQQPMWSSGDTVWMRETDDLDIPWLVRYRLRPTGRER